MAVVCTVPVVIDKVRSLTRNRPTGMMALRTRDGGIVEARLPRWLGEYPVDLMSLAVFVVRRMLSSLVQVLDEFYVDIHSLLEDTISVINDGRPRTVNELGSVAELVARNRSSITRHIHHMIKRSRY